MFLMMNMMINTLLNGMLFQIFEISMRGNNLLESM